MSPRTRPPRVNPLSRRAVLAIAAVVDVALHARPAPVSAKAMAERHALPHRHLEQILQVLVHAGLLRSVRGPRGGYELARERRRVSVGDIVRAAGSDGEMLIDGRPGWPLVDDVIAPALRDASAAYLRHLDEIMVADLCARAEPNEMPGNTDFTI